MPWTSAQCERIILSYGHDGEAFCPEDHHPLVFVVVQRTGSRLAQGYLHCPCCGERMSTTWLPSLDLSRPWLTLSTTPLSE